jgi:hypothetical protein
MAGDDRSHTAAAEGTSEDDRPGASLTEPERAALHRIELGLERLQRAQGSLLEFHHSVGHGVEHLAAAEEHLREAGHDDLADRVRDRCLPQGVTDRDRWSYAVVEGFQDGLLADVKGFETEARTAIADGRRHVVERRQEREYRDRARD